MPVLRRRVIEPLEHVTSKPMHCVCMLNVVVSFLEDHTIQ